MTCLNVAPRSRPPEKTKHLAQFLSAKNYNFYLKILSSNSVSEHEYHVIFDFNHICSTTLDIISGVARGVGPLRVSPFWGDAISSGTIL